MRLNVLIVEDSQDDADLVLRTLRKGGYDAACVRVDTREAMDEALRRERWDIVIADYSMPRFSGLAALGLLRETGLDLPFILISGAVGEDVAVEAMKAGAHDYVMKGNLARLVPAVERELREIETRRRHRDAEEQVRHLQKMEAMGQLAAGVAHDFNNLLTVIVGCVCASRETLGADHPAARHLAEIEGTVRRGAGLTRQLLSFARGRPTAPRALDLNGVISNLARMLRRLIGADVDLVTELAPDLWSVLADPGQIEQLLVNLAVNARDAMPKGGTLGIATANERRGEGTSAHEAHVLLSVRDTGIGMTRDVKARIFEPFFTTKGESGGTGLGLATCYGIVTGAGGSIEVESEPGAGTTFRINLPAAAREAATDAPETLARPPRGGHETVILAEDEPVIRASLAAALRRFGYTVHEASDGEQALRLFQRLGDRGGPHVLVTDVVMPRLSGPGLATAIRAVRPEIRVLYISGQGREASAADDRPSSPTLQKPFTPEVLAQEVRRVLDTHDAGTEV